MPEAERYFEPMSVGVLLDKSLRLYARNFSLMFYISAIVHIPSLTLAIVRVVRHASGTRIGGREAVLEFVWLMILLFIISPLSGGASARAVSDFYLGNKVTLADALRAPGTGIGH